MRIVVASIFALVTLTTVVHPGAAGAADGVVSPAVRLTAAQMDRIKAGTLMTQSCSDHAVCVQVNQTSAGGTTSVTDNIIHGGVIRGDCGFLGACVQIDQNSDGLDLGFFLLD